MESISELVKQDYDAEVEIIKEAGGNLWPKRIGLAIGVAAIWGVSLLFGDSWSTREICVAILFVIAAPFVEQVWQRYKVAAQMRHEREIRTEVKLDALLQLTGDHG